MTIEEIVLEAIKSIANEQDSSQLLNPDLNTALFGVNLDSMGIVLLVTDLEERMYDEFDISISLADERAMSQKTSPFRSVKTLIKYVEILVNEIKSNDK